MKGFRIRAFTLAGKKFAAKCGAVNGKKVKVTLISEQPYIMEFYFNSESMEQKVTRADIDIFFGAFMKVLERQLKVQRGADYKVEVLE